MIKSRGLWTLKPKLWTSHIWTLINNFVIVPVCAKFSKLITLEENTISVQQLPFCFPLFFSFSSEVLNSDLKSCFDGIVFQDAICEECFSICLRCLYERFIHKIILLSQFLPFTCISYPFKVFKFDTGILRDLCAVPLLTTLSRLPQSIAFLCLILFLMFASNNFPFRTFVIMIYWMSTEVLLNLVALLDSAVTSLYFEQINIFWTSSFDSVIIVFHSLSVSRSSLNYISRIRFRCSFFWPWENQYMVHGFDSISIAQFPAMICSGLAEVFLNCVAHSI